MSGPHRARQPYLPGGPGRPPTGPVPLASPLAAAGYSTADEPIPGAEYRRAPSPQVSIVPAPGGRSMLTSTRQAAITDGPPPDVVTRFFRPGHQGIVDPAGGSGYPNGALIHVPHFLVISRPAGKVAAPGPKTVDNAWNTISVPVGGTP